MSRRQRDVQRYGGLPLIIVVGAHPSVRRDLALFRQLDHVRYPSSFQRSRNASKMAISQQ